MSEHAGHACKAQYTTSRSLNFVKFKGGRSVIRVSSVGLHAPQPNRSQKPATAISLTTTSDSVPPKGKTNWFHSRRPEGSKTCAISADGSGDFPQRLTRGQPPNAVLKLNDLEAGRKNCRGVK